MDVRSETRTPLRDIIEDWDHASISGFYLWYFKTRCGAYGCIVGANDTNNKYAIKFSKKSLLEAIKLAASAAIKGNTKEAGPEPNIFRAMGIEDPGTLTTHLLSASLLNQVYKHIDDANCSGSRDLGGK